MLAPVLWTIAGCAVVFVGAGVFYLRLVYETGYQHGAADVQLRLNESLHQQLGKETPRG